MWRANSAAMAACDCTANSTANSNVGEIAATGVEYQ